MSIMKILVVANRKTPKTIDAAFQIAGFLESQGIEHLEIDVNDLPCAADVHGEGRKALKAEYGPDFGLIVTLGGDGTLLHAARLANVLEAPILGINFGHLGFLTNTAEKGIISLLADALSGEIVHETRMNLRIQVQCEDDEDNPPTTPREFFAFNEIVIARGALGHIVDFDFDISGDRISHMRGDGLIVSTATGSTAYALSAGGPLVGPSHRGMIVVPLAPHTLNSRAMVTEHHDVVEMQLHENSAAEVSLFVDGDALEFDRPIQNVIVSVGEQPTILLTQREESFYKQIGRTFFNQR